MRVLVTGGAGYIGGHLVASLIAGGHGVVALDDLSTGFPARIPGADLIIHELAGMQPAALAAALDQHSIDAVVHLAALKRVDESQRIPLTYHRQNVGAVLTLLEGMRIAGVSRLVFSSSAAVYGEVTTGIVNEAAPTTPLNPYGRSKLIGEQIITDAAFESGVSAASLRYFNVAGASSVDLADVVATNLVPIAIDRVLTGRQPVIFGDDFPTPDGTGIRDYVHVADLADAHLAVLEALDADPSGVAGVYNVGTGSGSSVREVILAVERAAGRPITSEVVGRRAGDPAMVVADVAKITERIGWRARFDLDDIVGSAWSALSARQDDSAPAPDRRADGERGAPNE